MAVDLESVLADVREVQRLAVKRYSDDPLPATDGEARARLQGGIERHGLEHHVVDLELQGYTVLPPGKACSTEFTDRLRVAILRVSDERMARGVSTALGQGVGKDIGAGRPLFHLLREDPVFQEAVTNPVVLTLVTYLAGYRARLATTTALIKTNESDIALYWHTDNSGKVTEPWPQQSLSANVNWILTDYSRENGALCVVRGSHNWCREPDSGFSFDDNRVHVVEVPAGSIAVWHANLWHAAMPRTTGGRRISYVTLYERPYLQQNDVYPLTTTPEMIERNPARFSVLVGLASGGYTAEDGPDFALSPTRALNMGRWM
jgi:Phytanoyl-CoA dioxygenase (PhyH)